MKHYIKSITQPVLFVSILSATAIKIISIGYILSNSTEGVKIKYIAYSISTVSLALMLSTLILLSLTLLDPIIFKSKKPNVWIIASILASIPTVGVWVAASITTYAAILLINSRPHSNETCPRAASSG
jgi:hypothetical protein